MSWSSQLTPLTPSLHAAHALTLSNDLGVKGAAKRQMLSRATAATACLVAGAATVVYHCGSIALKAPICLTTHTILVLMPLKVDGKWTSVGKCMPKEFRAKEMGKHSLMLAVCTIVTIAGPVVAVCSPSAVIYASVRLGVISQPPACPGKELDVVLQTAEKDKSGIPQVSGGSHAKVLPPSSSTLQQPPSPSAPAGALPPTTPTVPSKTLEPVVPVHLEVQQTVSTPTSPAPAEEPAVTQVGAAPVVVLKDDIGFREQLQKLRRKVSYHPDDDDEADDWAEDDVVAPAHSVSPMVKKPEPAPISVSETASLPSEPQQPLKAVLPQAAEVTEEPSSSPQEAYNDSCRVHFVFGTLTPAAQARKRKSDAALSDSKAASSIPSLPPTSAGEMSSPIARLPDSEPRAHRRPASTNYAATTSEGVTPKTALNIFRQREKEEAEQKAAAERTKAEAQRKREEARQKQAEDRKAAVEPAKTSSIPTVLNTLSESDGWEGAQVIHISKEESSCDDVRTAVKSLLSTGALGPLKLSAPAAPTDRDAAKTKG